MATVLEEDKDKREEEEQSVGGAPVATGTGAAPAPRAPQQKGSGRAANIQKYIQANVGAGQKLAENIGQGVQQQADEVAREVGQRQTAFEAQTQPLQQQLGEQAEQKIQTAFQNPQEILQQQQQLEQFQRLRDRGYQQDIQGLQTDISGLQSQAQNLRQQAEQARTEEGRFGLLREQFGQAPGYTTGQQRLDQLFLQTAPGAARGLYGDLSQAAGQTAEQVTELGEDLSQRQQALQQLSQQRAQEIQNILTGGVEEGLEEDISQRGLQDIQMSTEQRLQQAEEALAQVPGLQQRLMEDTLTQEDMQALGLEAGTRLYDVNLADYLQGISPGGDIQRTPTLAGVADPEEFARYQALRQLAGQEADIFSGMTPEEVGTFTPYDYDISSLQEQLGRREQQVQEQVMDYLPQMQQAFGGGSQYSQQLRNRLGQAGVTDIANRLQQDFRMEDVPALVDAMDQFYSGISGGRYANINRPQFNQLRDFLQNMQYRRTLNPNLENDEYFGVE